MQTGAHVGIYRRVGEVQLEHADLVGGGARVQGLVDLHGLGAGRAGIVGVTIEVREPGHDGAVGGFEDLVFGAVLAARAVIGEDDVAGQVAQAQAQDIVAAHGPVDQPAQVHPLGRADVLAERATVEDRLHRRPSYQQRLRASLGYSPLLCLGAVAGPQGHAQEYYGDGRGRGIDGQQAWHRAAP